MKRILLTYLAGFCCLAWLASSAAAKAIMIRPIPYRVALSECVVIGKVTAIEEKSVKAPRFPGDKELGEYQVAVVKIDEALVGVNGLTHIKVGFLPPPTPGGPPRRGFRGATLALGQEACLFLSRQPGAPFYKTENFFDVIDKKNPTFAKEVAGAKKIAQLLAKPLDGLKSKNPQERFGTAALLLVRYRTPLAGATATQPIDATESRLILEALANADWNQQLDSSGIGLNAQSIFYQLRLTPKDGWVNPKNFKEFPDLAKKWLKENATTYRIERFVVPEEKR